MVDDQKDDVNDVLDDVIIKINRITDHLRDEGENEAANRFTHEMTNTLRALYNIIAPWDIEQCLMKRPPNPQSSANITSSHETYKQTQKPLVASATWAAIAAAEPVADRNGVIKSRPGDSLHLKRSRGNMHGPNIHDEAHDETLDETHDETRDHRVLWIRPWNAERPLQDITKKMQTIGAIYSIAYAPEAEAVCVIFQHASCATEFMRRCMEHAKGHGISLFGPDHEVAPGLPYSMTPDLARMESPHMERRRLTFARAGLFNKEGVTQHRFRKDIEGIVGHTNVELLWLFNTGNATVVFSAVPLARLVRDSFLEFGRSKSSPYFGVMVGYSHDPCERDMHLVSQIPGHPGYIGSNNITTSTLRPRINTLSSNGSNGASGHNGQLISGTTQKRRSTNASGPKGSMDEDGWQMVKKRR